MPRCSISGYVFDSDGVPLKGASLKANGFSIAKSEFNGFYTIEGLAPGLYTIQVDYLGMNFISLVSNNVECPTNLSGLDFYVMRDSQFSISGRVVNMQGQGLPNVPVAYSRKQDAEDDKIISSLVITDIDGRYIIEKLPFGVYQLSISLPGYYFTPHTRVITLPPNAKDQDFVGSTPIRITYQISGEVKDNKGKPIQGAYIYVGGKFRAVTDKLGNYNIRGCCRVGM
jgi:protocatechuate 3,4-dioxygenase beta subunit